MKLTPVRKHVKDVQKAIETNRQSFIGGSDAGTILGVNPYKSRYTLWAEKCGYIEPEQPTSLRVKMGHLLEPTVADLWMEETGKKCRVDNSEYSLKEYPYLVGHIDRRVIGENSGLEIKTVSQFDKSDYAEGEAKEMWRAQCVFYMAVTGCTKWYLAILRGFNEIYFMEVERNEEEIEAVISSCSAFWQSVKDQIPPVVDGSDSTRDTLDSMWDGVNDTEVVDLTNVSGLLDDLSVLKHDKDEIIDKEEEIKNRIRAELGEYQVGAVGRWKVIWKPQETKRLDTTRLKAERPDIYEQYSKTTESRSLRITKINEKKRKD